MVQFAWGLLMYEGFNSLSVTERIHSTHSTHSIHAREARNEADAEQWPLIKGQRGGCHGVTETEATRAIRYLEIKACVGLEAVHLGGAVPFLESPSTSFSLLVKQRCMTT